VNVHPSKTEVRFRHGSFVHDFLRDAIRERLMESRPAPSFSPAPRPASAPVPMAQPAARLPYSEFSQILENEEVGQASRPVASPVGQAFSPADDVRVGQALSPANASSTLPDFTLRPTAAPPPRLDFSAPAIEVTSGLQPSSRRDTAIDYHPDTHGEFPPEAIPPPEVSLSVLSDLRPLGQIHESFIIAAGRDGLWIIDQHVAHERILFEQVMKQRAAGRVETQRLLMPLILQLTPEQQIDYARIAEELYASGFETEPFGNRTIAVKAAPAAVSPSDLEKILFEVLEISETELRSASLDDLRRGICASIACRAAIKINTRLDGPKMDWLLRSLAATDCPMSCPHGRPIALHYPTREILKAFHRI